MGVDDEAQEAARNIWLEFRERQSKLRDRILLELDMTNALRPSELSAFRWKRFDYKACTLTVAEIVYKGNIRDWGKTKKSLTVIYIPKEKSAQARSVVVGRRKPVQRLTAKDTKTTRRGG